MAHRLALATGRVDVDQMLDELSPMQWCMWQAYYEVEPFGDPWWMACRIMEVMEQVWGEGKRTEEDFRPQFTYGEKMSQRDKLAEQERLIAARYGNNRHNRS